jgi:hypothetical protein
MHGFVEWVDAEGAVTAALALVRLGAPLVAAWFAACWVIAVLAEGTAIGALATRALPMAVLVTLGASPAAAEDGPGTATMSVVPDEPATPPTVRQQPADRAPAPAPSPPPDEWLVEPGDSFWSIAESVVGDRLGHPPSDAETDPYWRRLVDANRDRIVSGDADVITPGQRFVLPV